MKGRSGYVGLLDKAEGLETEKKRHTHETSILIYKGTCICYVLHILGKFDRHKPQFLAFLPLY